MHDYRFDIVQRPRCWLWESATVAMAGRNARLFSHSGSFFVLVEGSKTTDEEKKREGKEPDKSECEWRGRHDTNNTLSFYTKKEVSSSRRVCRRGREGKRKKRKAKTRAATRLRHWKEFHRFSVRSKNALHQHDNDDFLYCVWWNIIAQKVDSATKKHLCVRDAAVEMFRFRCWPVFSEKNIWYFWCLKQFTSGKCVALNQSTAPSRAHAANNSLARTMGLCA